MDYGTLSQKIVRFDPDYEEDMKDLLTLTYVVPDTYSYSLYQVPVEFIARPDLISIAHYGTDDYTDVICKLNGISNPFELNEGMILILPSPVDARMFVYTHDRIERDDNNRISWTNRPSQKRKVEKRKANESVVGDSRYNIDPTHRVVIY